MTERMRSRRPSDLPLPLLVRLHPARRSDRSGHRPGRQTRTGPEVRVRGEHAGRELHQRAGARSSISSRSWPTSRAALAEAAVDAVKSTLEGSARSGAGIRSAARGRRDERAHQSAHDRARRRGHTGAAARRHDHRRRAGLAWTAGRNHAAQTAVATCAQRPTLRWAECRCLRGSASRCCRWPSRSTRSSRTSARRGAHHASQGPLRGTRRPSSVNRTNSPTFFPIPVS